MSLFVIFKIKELSETCQDPDQSNDLPRLSLIERAPTTCTDRGILSKSEWSIYEMSISIFDSSLFSVKAML